MVLSWIDQIPYPLT